MAIQNSSIATPRTAQITTPASINIGHGQDFRQKPIAQIVTSENISQNTQTMPAKNAMFLQCLAKIECGSLVLHQPDKLCFKFVGSKPGPDAEIYLHNWNLPGKIFSAGSIGAGESYMNDDWDSPDITELIELFVVNERIAHKFSSPNWFFGPIGRFIHWCNDNNRRGARKNIAAHYDLGNEFYSKWLDETMTYSSGIFDNDAVSLSASQINKYSTLAKSMEIESDDHLLEIGCGWGGFAHFAARELGCRITALTISPKQHEFARKRIFEAGLSDKVDIKLQDYRDETGTYDKIASIEMFEAVGEKYWQSYFNTLEACLHKNGTAGLQIITIPNSYYQQYSKRPDFIQRYIFPGGMLPSPQILENLSARTGMTLLGEKIFAHDYAKTLAEWRRRFADKWKRNSSPLGFDERFKRMWEFYLHYCEAGFKAEHIDVRQLIYKK